MDFLKIGQRLVHQVIRNRTFNSPLNISGRFNIVHYNKEGDIIGNYFLNNSLTTVGKNYWLDTAFNDGTKLTSWYIGLIDNSGFLSSLPETDTMSSHPNWTEFTSYDEATRVAWGQGAAASGVVTNATPAQFTINGSGTIIGIFIVSDNTKSGTTGTLWSTCAYTETVPLSSGDQLKITYAVSS